MNKYQKERSREIRDIMRSDRWGRMTYKEAKRKWRNGVRAFRIGDMYDWKAADISHLGFSRKQLKEVGQAYYKILKYCAERGLTFDCVHDRYFDFYEMSFKGRTVDGKHYRVNQKVTGELVRQCTGRLVDLTDHVLENVNVQLREFTLPSVIKTDIGAERLYPRMTIHPWDYRSVESVLGKVLVREE